jgi:hypothetical protein
MFLVVFNSFVKAWNRSGRVPTRSTWFANSGKISLVTPESKTVSSRTEKREETKTSSLNVNMIKGKWQS